jgi:hypothetical protein
MDNQQAIIERDRSGEGVVLVQLTEQNKENLLGKTTKLVADQKNANEILQRLTTFNSAFASNFAWKQSAVSEAPLKLLFSRYAAVGRGRTQSVESYVIISYCWHDSSQNGRRLAAARCKTHGQSIVALLKTFCNFEVMKTKGFGSTNCR